MDTLDLTELDGVNGQANVSVPGKPGSMVMIINLVSIADAVLLDPPVSANIKHRGKTLPLLSPGWKVEVARDVKSGTGLVMKLLHGKPFPFKLARNLWLQIGTRTVGGKSEHIPEAFPVLALELVPILLVIDFLKE